MKKIFSNIFAAGSIVFLLSISVFAQNDKTVSNVAQNYVISAKAGGVNFVEGMVTVLRKTGKSGYLIRNDNLEIGDKVSTGTNGKAEILLNPGSYIRLAENSEFEFITTSLDDLKLKLTRGSAMLEVYAGDDFRVIINTPGAQFYAVQSGVYRVDVIGEMAKIEVWEGKAQIGDTSATVVKAGREASVNGSQVAVAKFDRDEQDALETWSRARAKELTKINARLEKKALRDTLIASYNSSNSWNVYDSFGLWIYNASYSGYCFLPFGSGWYSPYGYNYGWNLWNIKVPTYIYNPPVNPVSPINPNSSDLRNSPVKIAPPFEQIQDNGGVQIRKSNPTLIDDNMSIPMNNMPSQPVRVITPPATKTPSTSSDN